MQASIITGIGGFVGGFLAEHLMARGDDLLGATLDGAWEPDSEPRLANRVELVPWDIGRTGGLSDAARRQITAFRPRCIYHLAAISVPGECGDRRPTPLALAVNVDGTRRVLELAASLPSRPRVIIVSSSRVYAPVMGEDARVDEMSPIGPATAYGQTKLAAEAEVRRAVVQLGVDALLVRPFQHAGPRQSSKMMLAQWASQLVSPDDRPIEIYTRDAFIDLTDVRDVVRAYRLLAERGKSGEVYNIGSGIRRRSGDIFEMLRRAAGSSRPVIERMPGVKYDPIADTTRLRKATGWHPTVSIETTVADTLAWWQRRKPQPPAPA